MFDQDNNGYITRDELKKAMEVIGENVTETQLSEMLTLADLDKDGKINYEGNSIMIEISLVNFLRFKVPAVKNHIESQFCSNVFSALKNPKFYYFTFSEFARLLL